MSAASFRLPTPRRKITMAELRGKGWRVFGYFVWMLGAGLVLEGDAQPLAGVILAAGCGLFVLGVLQSIGGNGRQPG